MSSPLCDESAQEICLISTKTCTLVGRLEGGRQPQGSSSSVGGREEGVWQAEVAPALCYCRNIGKWPGSPLVPCGPR